MGRIDEEVKHPVTWRSCLLVVQCARCGVSWHCAARPFLVFLAKKGEGILTHKLPRPLCSSWSACGFYCQRVFKGQVLLTVAYSMHIKVCHKMISTQLRLTASKNRLDIRRKRQMDFFKDWMSTRPMAARECWIYGECLKIRMMVPGAAAPVSVNTTSAPISDLSLLTATTAAAARVHSLQNCI